MEGKRFLHSIKLTNLLSYGSEGVFLELEPLNVLIGPNASGKSNLIEAIGLLAAAPRDLLAPFREAGGSVRDWLWKGVAEVPIAELEVRIGYSARGKETVLCYRLAFGAAGFGGSRLRIVKESLDDPSEPTPSRLFAREDSRAAITEVVTTSVPPPPPPPPEERELEPQQSLLSQVRDPLTRITFVGTQLGRTAFFREWSLGSKHPLRRPQDVSLPDDFLLEDASNLGLVLNDLQNRPETKARLVEKLKLFYEGVEDFTTKVQGGTIQVFFHETGLKSPVPASRLSDGTLHYLGLLSILLHPEPPPLVCIEEPELGLHPDILPKVADMLIEASQRTQLIVTTHSDTLVSRLSEVPESVVVCERDDRGTSLRRLEPAQMKEWLESYLLGELWRMGEIGGNRW